MYSPICFPEQQAWTGSLMATNNTASIAQARKLVEQLKMEANIDRIKVRRIWTHYFTQNFIRSENTVVTFMCLHQVSKAAADLTSYCEAHAKEDPLLSPVPASENPFREKKFFCAIL